MRTQYGNNHYEIKLYGPFGEKEVRIQDLVLDQNALAKGQLAYSVYGLDDKQRLINNQSNENYSLNNRLIILVAATLLIISGVYIYVYVCSCCW